MKKILFIDHDILLYDQFAGSRTNYMYLKLFLEMGFSVTFICTSFRDIEPYTSQMRMLGAKVLTGNFFSKIWKLWFKLCTKKFDIVFCNKPIPTHFFLPYVEKYTKAKIIYQCHDLHYLRLKRQYELDGSEQALSQSKEMEELETKIAKKTDIFLTFSWHEKDLIEKKFPMTKTEVVPLFFYKNINPPITDFNKRSGLLYVGGFGHTPNVDAVLWFTHQIFPEVIKTYPDIKLYIVGSNPPDKIKKLSSDNIQILGYVTDEQLIELYSHVKLAVIPLRYGAGVKGKTIEAIHHSLPLISTSIGIEGIGIDSIIQPKDSANGFSNRIKYLYNNNEELKNISSDLHAYSKENLDEITVKNKLLSLFKSLK